jgi:hypothetical protein
LELGAKDKKKVAIAKLAAEIFKQHDGYGGFYQAAREAWHQQKIQVDRRLLQQADWLELQKVVRKILDFWIDLHFPLMFCTAE